MSGQELEQLYEWMRPEVRGLHAYQPEDNTAEIHLDANESPYDIPKALKERILGYFEKEPWHRYPDPDCHQLRQAIAAYESVNANQILIGNGSDELIKDLMLVFGGQGNRIIFPTPTFGMYRLLAMATGATPVGIQLNDDWSLDIEGMIKEITAPNTRLVFIASPNNPTGVAYAPEVLEQLIQQADGIVVIDEAYRLFSSVSYRELMKKYANVVCMHTFSKSFSLAGLRIGYMIADPKIIDAVNRVRLPYNVDCLVQVAARLVLEHKQSWDSQIDLIKQERQRMETALRQVPGLVVYPSQANFLLIKHQAVSAIKQALQEANISVRGFDQSDRLSDCLRLSIGRPEENNDVLQVIRKVLA